MKVVCFKEEYRFDSNIKGINFKVQWLSQYKVKWDRNIDKFHFLKCVHKTWF